MLLTLFRIKRAGVLGVGIAPDFYGILVLKKNRRTHPAVLLWFASYNINRLSAARVLSGGFAGRIRPLRLRL